MTGINPLNPLLGKIEKFEDTDRQVRQWESARVEWTLRRLSLDIQLKQLRKDTTGGRFTFEDFAGILPTFPVQLRAETIEGLPLHRNPKAIHPLWFKSFRHLSFVESYERLFGELADKDKPLGMVFPRKGFLHGLIIHNGDWDLFVAPQSSCHMFKGGSKRSMNLIVQPYMSFIDNIKSGLAWSP